MVRTQLFIVQEVLENSDSEDELSQDEGESEDDFDGYIDEEEVIQNWETERNSGVEDDEDNIQDGGRSNEGQSSNEDDMDTVQSYTLQPGCSVP